MTKKEIAALVKARREEWGLSIYNVAKFSKLDYKAIKAIEGGKLQYTFDSLQKLCQYLKLELKLDIED